MKKLIKYTAFLLPVLLLATGVSCTSDNTSEVTSPSEKGLLRISVDFMATRVAELTDPSQMNEEYNGLSDVGLYVYYTDDYNRGDLSQPYVRNLRCEVQDGQLVIIIGEDDDPSDANVFIYDRMTVVAFYPYNANVADFNVKADEEKYPITLDDYDQKYIPYRAQTETDPTRAFLTRLTFVPKHTYKVEVVVVSDDPRLFPEGEIKILPGNDPVGNTATGDGARQVWIDKAPEIFPNDDNTGSEVRRYTAYLWTVDGNRNDIKMGDVLLESGNVQVIALHDITVAEDLVYRYGCNLSTGEVFIPTSETLINTRSRLSGLDNSSGNGYQVCDIDFSKNGGDWTPIKIFGGRFDGGGHKISNMTVSALSADNSAGLFSRIQGNATVCNVDLVDPVINVTSTADTCYVGALTGRLNAAFSEADKHAMIGSLPPGLSEVVREALEQELLAALGNSTANIVACKVENPTITVTGKTPFVGSVAGLAGGRDDENTFKSQIWDTYVTEGSISVNSGSPDDNAGGYAGGFVGLNNGYITRSYTTTGSVTGSTIDFMVPGEETTDPPVDGSKGFGTMGSAFTSAEGGSIVDCYATLPDDNISLKQLPEDWPSPSWVTYSGRWPIITTGWLSTPEASFWYSTGMTPDNYPTLQWERK